MRYSVYLMGSLVALVDNVQSVDESDGRLKFYDENSCLVAKFLLDSVIGYTKEVG